MCPGQRGLLCLCSCLRACLMAVTCILLQQRSDSCENASWPSQVDSDGKSVKEELLMHLDIEMGNEWTLPVTPISWLCFCNSIFLHLISKGPDCVTDHFCCLRLSCGQISAMSDTSSGFTGPELPMFLNVTAPTEILLCEETLEMILTVTTILPLSHSPPSACSFPLPSLKHTSLCVCQFSWAAEESGHFPLALSRSANTLHL